ncbi:MAG: hypothetical protein WCH79_18400 [Planctomycetia bacterium]
MIIIPGAFGGWSSGESPSRVPGASVIQSLFEAEPLADGGWNTDLRQRESQGKTLENRAALVEARKAPGPVIAIEISRPVSQSMRVTLSLVGLRIE